MRTGLVLLLALLLAPRGAPAAEGGVYGPLPPALEAVKTDPQDAALVAKALPRAPQAFDVRRAPEVLALLGDVGLKAAAERLARGDLAPGEGTVLLGVVAASPHPAADVLLARAVADPRASRRVVAAHGLGRARTPAAIPALAALARDPVPAVRIAAVRSLFAIESPAARAARLTLPADSEPDLLACRLRWHARVGDAAPSLEAMAEAAFRHGRTSALRTAAALYLAQPGSGTPVPVLARVARETGGGPLLATWVRRAAGVPTEGYDPVLMRRIAIRAVLSLLAHPDLEPRARRGWIRLALWWVAHPVDMDPYSDDPIPEDVLRRRLPDLGPEILPPLLDLLRQGAFHDPRTGVILVRELGPEVALPVLRRLLAAGPPATGFVSHLETGRLRYLRSAAAGALGELGHIGSAALAQALLREDGREPVSLRVDVLDALSRDDGAWVVPLLIQVARGHEAYLRSRALGILAERPEPAARAFLVEDLFERAERPQDRMAVLVHPGDDVAFAVLARALDDPRQVMRLAAFSQFRRGHNPLVCGARGRKLVLAHAPQPARLSEVEGYLNALLSVAPEEAVRTVRSLWKDLRDDGARETVLRILSGIHEPKARRAAIDLALEKMTPKASAGMLLHAAGVLNGTPGPYDWTYRVKDAAPRWRALLGSDNVHLQRAALEAWQHPKAPEASARLLALLDRALANRALPERDSTPEGEQAFAELVLRALAHQPWAKVEGRLVAVTLNPLLSLGLREVAAQSLIGRLTPGARSRLVAWLGFGAPAADGEGPTAAGRNAEPDLLLYLAAAVGTGADAATANALMERLRRVLGEELWPLYQAPTDARLVGGLLPGEHTQGPLAVRTAAVAGRIDALARAIGSTHRKDLVAGLLSMVFDPHCAAYARLCVARQAHVARSAGPGAAAVVPSPLTMLGQDEKGSPNWGMPRVIGDVLYETKALDDDSLASALGQILDAERADGRLARFPALYMRRVLQYLLEPRTGRKPRTAALVFATAQAMGDPDGPAQMFLEDGEREELAQRGRFGEAARVQRARVRAIARGGHDDARPGLWARERALQDALEGAAAATRGDAARAHGAFVQAVARAPYDPDVLNYVAWYMALAGFDLPRAEALARRATRLQARVESRPALYAIDTMAWILLRRGRPRAGIALLEPHMRSPDARRDGMLHLHLAQMYAAAGGLRKARDLLVLALTWDRALVSEVPSDPWLAPVLARQPLAQIEALAARERLAKDLP